MKWQWRIFLVSLGLIAITAVCLVWGSVLQAEELQQKEVKLQGLQTEIADLQRLQEEHGNLEEYQQEAERKKERAAKLLPDEMETAELLTIIKRNADASGMELQELMPGECEQGEELTQMRVNVSVSGDYFSLLEFLRRLQSSTRLVHVEEMDVQQKDSLECRLGLLVYAEKA